MIITRTPFRISLAGGGTDFKNFFSKEDGKVISFTIDKYIYVMVKRQIGIVDYKYKISWSQIEYCNKIDDIKHPIVRETLKYFKIDYPIEISTYADVPSQTGLGSSSAFAVGLVNAIYSLQNKQVTKYQIAKVASEIEIDILKRPMGKQDHYACCYGNVNTLTFKKHEVEISPVFYSKNFLECINNNFFLIYTKIRRDSSKVLKKQVDVNLMQTQILLKMKDQVNEILDVINKDKNFFKIGSILDQGWKLKKKISSKITSSKIENYYKKLKTNGAIGGKLLGAGGGGFLLIQVNKNKKKKVLNSVKNLHILDFKLDTSGTRVTYYDNSF
jgi:D-glycero-alpha-D-manno-heptose-7-phosphate kinase